MPNKAEPRKIIVSWEEYLGLLAELIRKIQASDFRPKQIVCIARGGLIPGEIASRSFNAPLAVLSVASYPDKKTQQEEMMFSRDLTSAKPLERERILVIDDLTETGMTLKETVKWLFWWYSIRPDEVRTATVWHKDWSTFVPDYFALSVPQDPATGERPWIVQPQEQFCRQLADGPVGR